jgi:hypothetical protein
MAVVSHGSTATERSSARIGSRNQEEENEMRTMDIRVTAGLAALVALAIVASLGAGFAQSSLSGESSWVQFDGTSGEGFEAALNAATLAAENAANQGGADRMVSYEVVKISGQRGGITGQNMVKVTIRCPKSEFQNAGN